MRCCAKFWWGNNLEKIKYEKGFVIFIYKSWGHFTLGHDFYEYNTALNITMLGFKFETKKKGIKLKLQQLEVI